MSTTNTPTPKPEEHPAPPPRRLPPLSLESVRVLGESTSEEGIPTTTTTHRGGDHG